MQPAGKPSATPPHASSRLRQRIIGDAPADADNRWAKRKRSELPGYLRADMLDAAVKCCVRDYSSSGALLQLQADGGLTVDDVPDRLTLVLLVNRQQTEVSCTVVRRHGDCIGVRFAGMFKTTQAPMRWR